MERPVRAVEYEQLALQLFFSQEALTSARSRGARFFLRFAAILLDIAWYLKTEERRQGNVLIAELQEQIELAHDIAEVQQQMLDYLREVLLHITAINAGPLLERAAWKNQQLEEQTLSVPGMLDEDTMKYYKWLGSMMSGLGEVVELGCWMGCSTCCLAEGLALNKAFCGHRVHAFDRFRWAKWMDRFRWYLDARFRTQQPLVIGESFLDMFLEFCERYKNIIEPRVCDINEGDDESSFAPLTWSGKPIELFVYDMGLKYDQLQKVWKIFSPSFIPGKTYLVFNEYGKTRSEDLWHFCNEHSDQFIPVHKPDSSTKGFLFVKTS